MIEVVFEEVVFGQVSDIGKLHVWDVGGLEDADIHLGYCVCGVYRRNWGYKDVFLGSAGRAERLAMVGDRSMVGLWGASGLCGGGVFFGLAVAECLGSWVD